MEKESCFAIPSPQDCCSALLQCLCECVRLFTVKLLNYSRLKKQPSLLRLPSQQHSAPGFYFKIPPYGKHLHADVFEKRSQ